MKTGLLSVFFLVVALSMHSHAIASEVGSGMGFEMGPPLGVRVTNKDENPSNEIKAKQKVIQAAFEKAIRTYLGALDPLEPSHLQATLGFMRSPIARSVLSQVSVEVSILDKDDSHLLPRTYFLPEFGKGEAYITKVPLSIMEDINDENMFEYLALREIAHIVMGDITNRNEPLSELHEKNLHGEYLIYQTVGRKRYLELIKELIRKAYREASAESQKEELKNWLINMGADPE